MHLDDGVLAALLDHELEPQHASEAMRHIESCAECRGRLDALRADDGLLQHALAALDRPAAPTSIGAIVARARRRTPSLRWAAALALLVMGAGVLYAIPGSPVRAWVDRLVGRTAHQPTTPAPDTVAGVAMAPGASFRIVFGPSVSGTASIVLTDSATITVRSLSGTAYFTAETDGLRIEGDKAPAQFALGIPRAAPRVEVIVVGRQVFLKNGPQIVADLQPDSMGGYILLLPDRR